MRIYKYLFFSVLLVLTACKGGDTPADIIPQKDMSPILVDLNIVDGGLYDIPQFPDSLYKYGMGHYLAVFKKHHTDTLQFKNSYLYYTKNPGKLDAIYDDVIKILQKKNDSIAKIKVPLPKPMLKKDSVAAAAHKKDSIAKAQASIAKNDSLTKVISAKKDSVLKAKKAKLRSHKPVKPANAVSVK